jgi:ATP-dependent DNA helicase RecQ
VRRRGESIVNTQVDRRLTIAAGQFLRCAEMSFRPKRQVVIGAFEIYDFQGNLSAALQASKGRILSRWGDAEWGSLVANDKHAGYFRDELVEAVAEMIEQRWQIELTLEWVGDLRAIEEPSNAGACFCATACDSAGATLRRGNL